MNDNDNEPQEVIVWTKQASGDYEQPPLLEPGEYEATFIGIRTVAKPDNKLTGKEGEDLQQWEWRFDLNAAELEEYDYSYRKWTSRSLHEKSNAYGILKGMGRPLPQDGVPYDISEQVGCLCRIVLNTYAKTKADGTKEERNYIESWLPPRRARAPQAQAQAPVAATEPPKPVGKAQISDIIQLAKRAGMPIEKLCNDLGISDLKVLSEKKADKLIVRLRAIVSEKEYGGPKELVGDTAGTRATEAQIKTIYQIGRSVKRLSESQMDDKCMEVFGVLPIDLTKGEASQFIDILKGNPATPAAASGEDGDEWATLQEPNEEPAEAGGRATAR